MERFTDILIEKGISKSEDKDIICHGLSTGIELMINIITTVALGVLYNLIVESLIFLISFSCIRTYAGGYHCKSSTNCYLMSSGIIALVLTIIKFTADEYIIVSSVVILLISVPIILKIAPISATLKPLDNIEKNHFKKKMTFDLLIECVLVPTLFIVGVHSFAYAICCGITVSAYLVFLQRLQS